MEGHYPIIDSSRQPPLYAEIDLAISTKTNEGRDENSAVRSGSDLSVLCSS